MSRKFKNILVFVIVSVMLLPMLFACGNTNETNINNTSNNETLIPNSADGDETNLYVRNGEFIEFGRYPQTVKGESVELDVTSQKNSDGYYIGPDGNLYVYMEKPTLAYEGYKFNGNSGSISAKSEYFYKIEPIKWRILEEREGEALIVTDNILLGGMFGPTNQYRTSALRNLVNGAFLGTAFNDNELDIIIEKPITNEVSTTRYTDGNEYADKPEVNKDTGKEEVTPIKDKAFVLSYQDLITTKYGFSTDEFTKDVNRQFILSDYARANNVLMNIDSELYGVGAFWTRSPVITRNNRVSYVEQDGTISEGNASFEKRGIVVAIWIKL